MKIICTQRAMKIRKNPMENWARIERIYNLLVKSNPAYSSSGLRKRNSTNIFELMRDAIEQRITFLSPHSKQLLK